MKPLIHADERKRSIANIVTGCSIVLFAMLVYHFSGLLAFFSRMLDILAPFIMGLVVAFLLSPPQVFFEQRFHKWFDRYHKNKKPPRFLYRIITTTILYAAFLALIIGFLSVVLPSLVDSIRQLIESVTRYLNAHQVEIQAFMADLNLSGTTGENNFYNSLIKLWNDFATSSLSYTGQLLKGIVNISAGVGTLLSNFFIGFVVSINMLFAKERFAAQAKKLGCAFMRREQVELLSIWFRKTEHIFSRYLIGQLLSSVVVATLTYIFMLSFKMDYPLLISVLIGVTNIIPFFGPIIGGIVGGLILLITSPMNALIFGIFILILQQIEGNIISPRIMSDSVGISSFWVILSIILGGGLFGVVGIVIGIPVFALIYAILGGIVATRLEKKGLPKLTSAYGEQELPKPESK